MSRNLSFNLKLTKAADNKMKTWIDQQDKKVATRQGNSFPNYGCCGGAYRSA